MQPQDDTWYAMDTAPRDGTVIEIVHCYAMWSDLYEWIDDEHTSVRGAYTVRHKGRWALVGDRRRGIDESDRFAWRYPRA